MEEFIKNKKFRQSFKIKDIQPLTMKIPLKKPIKMAGISVESADNLFVKITSENGLYGWGEASSAPTMTGEFSEGMYAAALFIRNQLIGREFKDLNDIKILKKIPIYENKGTLSAFEMALIDLMLKHNNISFNNFFGKVVRKKIPVIQMIAGVNVDEEIRNLNKSISIGFSCFKIKIGSANSYKDDLERCKKITNSTNNKCIFSADANEGYNYEDAINFAKKAKDVGIKFFEQPVSSKNLDEMKSITSISSVPICSDEGVHSLNDIHNIIKMKSSNGVSLKTIKLGGILDVINCAFLAYQNNIHINLAGKVAETSISSYAISRIASFIPQMDWDLSITNQYLIEDPVLKPLIISNGSIHLEENIGLGTVLDMGIASKYIDLHNNI